MTGAARVAETVDDASSDARASAPASLPRRLLRSTIHLLSYHFILKRRRTQLAHAAGFRGATARPLSPTAQTLVSFET